MKLSYDEIQRYYHNGLLNDLIVRGGTTSRDIVEVLMSKAEQQEIDLGDQEAQTIKEYSEMDDLQSELYHTKEQLEEVKEELNTLKQEYESLLRSSYGS